jgi:predicted amidohydrolase
MNATGMNATGMRIGFCQFAPRFGDTEGNLEHVASALRRTRAELLVAPELALSGYLFGSRREVERLAEPLPGPATETLQRAARASGCHLVIGLAERAGRRLFNSAALIGPQGLLGRYRKLHLFAEEKLYFAPGDSGFPLFEVEGVKVGLLVCFDHMFPEAARTLALAGAQLICHPSNLVLPEYGQLTTRVRSIENRVFWVLANRHGREERHGRSLRYTGCSQITASDGRILARAEAEADAVQVVEIDPAEAVNKKVTPYNDLFGDRRPEAYRLR